MSDLGVRTSGTVLERRIERLYAELARKNLHFRPYFWMSDDWFTPQGMTGIAIPFYLAHPRLIRLERDLMGEAEGAAEPWCMKLLRHEAGHAVDHAFQLTRRTRPRVRTRAHIDSVRTLRKSLREHYRHKRSAYALEHPDSYDQDLRRLFSASRGSGRREPAATFVRRVRRAVVAEAARWTGEHRVPQPQVGRRARKLRVLTLLGAGLEPPESIEDLTDDQVTSAPWKMEFDVVSALNDLGHAVEVIGVHSDLAVIRRALEEFRPHVAFNLLEEFGGLSILDQHVVIYLQLRTTPYTGCNPRGMMIARDKALSKKLPAYHRIPVPEFAVLRRGRKVRCPRRLRFPLGVAVREGNR